MIVKFLCQITVAPITQPLSLNLTPSPQQSPRTPSPPASKPDVQSDHSPIVRRTRSQMKARKQLNFSESDV